jgi:hypothetical protein
VQSGDCKSRLESGNDLAVSWDLLMLQRQNNDNIFYDNIFHSIFV